MQQLTPAEFKANRERMGLSTRWLATRWNTQEQSVQRWERHRQPPPEFVEDLLDLVDLFDAQVVTYLTSAHHQYVVPRVSVVDGYPAPWWRAAALEASRHTGAAITYDPQDL